MSNTKETGNYGEIQASNYLVKKGYTIIARNYYGKHGEIDIIAVTPDNTTLVFVEVKTRKSKLFGYAAESIDKKKIQSIIRTAENFMFENPSEHQIRFDVIEVYLKSKKINRVLIVATGALFSPTNVFQHKNINSISHAVVLEALK